MEFHTNVLTFFPCSQQFFGVCPNVLEFWPVQQSFGYAGNQTFGYTTCGNNVGRDIVFGSHNVSGYSTVEQGSSHNVSGYKTVEQGSNSAGSDIHIRSTSSDNKKPSSVVSWAFPPQGFIKINTDGSFMPHSGLGATGGVVRDDQGRFIVGFCGRIKENITSSLRAELWAIFSALSLVESSNWRKVIIETDSKHAVNLLSRNSNIEHHPDKELLEPCRRLIAELNVFLCHTLREGNFCADYLSKLGRSQDDEFVMVEAPPPAPLIQLLKADMAHVGYIRPSK